LDIELTYDFEFDHSLNYKYEILGLTDSFGLKEGGKIDDDGLRYLLYNFRKAEAPLKQIIGNFKSYFQIINFSILLKLLIYALIARGIPKKMK
jgi:hypothetical protein